MKKRKETRIIYTRPKMLYVGIDPGQNGGIAWIHSDPKHEPRAVAMPMPGTEKDVWDLLDIYGLGIEPEPDELVTATIEKVHSMPQQGVASTFKFGVGYGGLRMALIGHAIPFSEVTPQRWIKALEIPPRKESETPSQWKNRLKAFAQQLFPDVEVTLKTADALLIAEYCRRVSV